MKFQLECLQKSSQWPALMKIQSQIAAAGFQVCLNGGAVRDAFLGVEPHDFDLVTNASLEDLKNVFKKVILVGESFGVLRVIEEGQMIEVAQFRKEADYKDGRRPSLVSAATPQEDAHRRDFTVNALFYDFSSGQVLDFVDGQKDLTDKKLRCVGDARVRFQEDHLRILRAIRFEAQLGFSIEQKTWEACQSLCELTVKVSKERVQEELTRMLTGPRPWQAIQSLYSSGVMKVLFPERWESFMDVQSEMAELFKQPVPQKDLALSFFIWRLQNPAEFLDKNLKWPKKEEKRIVAALEIVNSKENFFKKRLGEQLLAYQDELTRNIFSKCKEFYLSSNEKTLLERLDKSWNEINVEDLLPAALVRAGDLPREVQGPKIGEVLREAFSLQLENSGWKKEEILKVVLTKS